jgi:hypothetical protein
MANRRGWRGSIMDSRSRFWGFDPSRRVCTCTASASVHAHPHACSAVLGSACMPACLHSFMLSFIHPIACCRRRGHVGVRLFNSFIISLIHQVMHAFLHSFINSFVHSSIHSIACRWWGARAARRRRRRHPFINSFIHSFMHSCIHPSIHSFMHACINPSIHPFIHLIACCRWFFAPPDVDDDEGDAVHSFKHSSINSLFHSSIH